MEKTEKIIKDCIYGHIKVPALCARFIDVPDFQRLRRVKQLGNVSRVYPSATHTRFEHSIGVMHLAGVLCDHLDIQDGPNNLEYRPLIQLAGLYHDIGHLPYSHLFDKALEIIKPAHIAIHHEDRSVATFLDVSRRLNLLTKEEERFVCACIKGEPIDGYPQYLFEIIASTIDVDKLDYLCRDAYHCGMTSFQSNYILLNARITDGHICFRKNASEDIKDMFETRSRMHKLVYQHDVSLQYDSMFICMIERLSQADAFTGDFDYSMLCDYKLDTLFMTHPATKDMYYDIEYRHKKHDMICADKSHNMVRKIENSGTFDDVRFVSKY
jgi:deoxynucleoside triphosphate triphosphohydrolase SAMHD1